MIFELFISNKAEFEIRETFLWYESQNEGLGNKFEQNLISVLDLIQSNPNLIQIRYKQIRVAFLSKFPFGIHYIVKENQILIIAILHTSTNPKKWIK